MGHFVEGIKELNHFEVTINRIGFHKQLKMTLFGAF
jgi:hypothetical protein